MKTFEFKGFVHPDGTLAVPAGVAGQVDPGQAVRVILLVPETDDDREWSQLTTEQFLHGYADSDAVYDQLSAG